MSLFSRIVARIGGAIKKTAEGIRLVGSAYGGGSWFESQTVDTEKLMREAKGWVFACVSKISETIGAAKIRVYRRTGSGPDDWEEVSEHPILDLLNKPNSWMPGSEFLQTWSMHEDLAGNVYWLLDGVKNEKTPPTALYPLNPGDVKVKVGTVQQGVLEYSLKQDGAERPLKTYEVLHFRRANPNNPYIGMGPTEAGIESIDSENWMREWNRRFFQNAAIPSSIFKTEETSPEAIRLLRESYEDRHAGVARSHKSLFLPKGVEFQDKGYGQKDMDFAELRRASRDEILAYYGVPAVVLGLGLGETMNRASAETLEYVFLKHTIAPKLKRLEVFLNEFFVPRFGDDIVVEFDDPVPANVDQEISMAQAALGSAPFLSVNEVRAKQGLPPIKNGDYVMGNALLSPLGSPEAGKGKRTPGAKAVTRSLPTETKRRNRVEALKNNVADAVVQSLKESAKRAKAKSVADLKDLDWSSMWKAFISRVTPQEKEMQEAMAEYAKDMAKRAEAAVRREFKGQKAVNISTILDRKDEIAAIIKLMDPIYTEILKKEGKAAAEMVDAAFDENEKRMRKALDKSISLMARKYTDETLTVLKDRLDQGLDEGEGVAALADSVAEIGEWSSTVRAERVAKTEAFRTANFATKEAWKQSGTVKTIKWYTADDERVCEYCSVMDGKVVGIEQNFIDKGDALEGADGGELPIDYADVEAGSLHPNCRCYVRPEDIEIG